MKTLKESILEKLSVDSITIGNYKNFPIDGTINDMIEFLENAGFKKIPSQSSWEQTFENYKKYNDKRFAISKSSTSIVEIIDRSNPKLKNKLFYIMLRPFKNYDDKYNIFDDITTINGNKERIVSKEEFLKELSEIL